VVGKKNGTVALKTGPVYLALGRSFAGEDQCGNEKKKKNKPERSHLD
jgi:hypothetical protein